MNRSTSKTGAFSCQCSTTLNGMQKETKNNVNTIHRQLLNMLANSLAVIGLSWGLDHKKNCAERTLTNQMDPGDRMTQETMANFSRSGHPIFRASSAIEWGELRSKWGRKKSRHFNGSNETIELLLRTVISANQLSIYGAITDLCDEVAKRIRAQHLSIWKRWKFLPSSVRQKIAPMNSSGETHGKNTSENSSNCQKTRSNPNCVLMRVWSLLNENNTSILLKQKKDNRCNTYAEIHAASQWKGDPCERMDSKQHRNRSSLEYKFAIVKNNIVLKFKFHLYFQTTPFRGSELWMALTGTSQNQCRSRKNRTQLRETHC